MASYILRSLQINLFSNQASEINTPDNSVASFFIQPIKQPENYYTQITLQNMILPTTFYTINDNNNVFSYTFNGTQFNIQITNGNHSVLSAIQEINTINNHFTIYYDRESNNTFIERKVGIAGTIIIIAKPINVILGYSQTQNTNINTNNGYSPYVCDISGIRMIMIHTQFKTDNIDSYTGLTNNIIASIPVNVPLNNILYYENNGFDKGIIVDEPLINNFQIKLTDKDYKELKLNGTNWQCVFKIDYIPKEQLYIQEDLLKYLKFQQDILETQIKNQIEFSQQQQEKEEQQQQIS